jgi:hypothetical protein
LKVPSGMKVQLATVEEKLVVKIVGQLAGKDAQVLNARLRNWLKL